MRRITWATATMAFRCPQWRAIRRYRAPRALSFLRTAAPAPSVSAARSQRLPLRVLPDLRFPALSWFPGQSPAELAKWRSLGNGAMSTPISAMTTSAVRRFTPGIASVQALQYRGERGHEFANLRTHGGNGFVQIVEVRQELSDEKRVMGRKHPARAWCNAGSFLRKLPRANSARMAASVVPWTHGLQHRAA
jgi:hypothetical protein